MSIAIGTAGTPPNEAASAVIKQEDAMVWLLGLVAFVGGSLKTVQSGANSVLSKTLGQPIAAALIVSAVNAVVYLLAVPFVGLALPKEGALS